MNDKTLIDKAKKIIEEKDLTSDDWKVGTCCRFIKVNEAWGVKLYEKKSVMEYTWNLQNIAYKNKLWEKQYRTKSFSNTRIDTNKYETPYKGPLSPEAGEWIDFKGLYGYLTKIADTNCPQDEDDVEALKNSLGRIGMNVPHDDFARQENLGYIDKNIVCIDFDAFSIRMLTHGGFLQYWVSRPDDGVSSTEGCDIHDEIKEILDWKSK